LDRIPRLSHGKSFFDGGKGGGQVAVGRSVVSRRGDNIGDGMPDADQPK